MDLQKSLPAQLPKLRLIDRFMSGHKGYIAGGCFKQLFLGEKIKDIDLFFETNSDADAAISYYSGNDEFKQVYSNDRVTGFKCQKTGIVVEVISSFLGSPAEMIGNFDFTITKAFYCKNELDGAYEFYHHNRFFEHLTNRKLVIDDRVLFPLSTFNRSYRYVKYGFGLCGESKTRLIQSLQGFNAVNINDFYFGID